MPSILWIVLLLLAGWKLIPMALSLISLIGR